MRKPKLVKYDIFNDKLSDVWTGYKIAFFADFHNNDYRVDETCILNRLEEFKPDCIMIAGDIIVSKPGSCNQKAYEFLHKLADRYKIYFSNGNHEFRAKIYPSLYGNMYDEFLSALKHDNIVHLVNETSYIIRDDEKIAVKGLEIDAWFYDRFKKHDMHADYIESKVGKKEDVYEILLAHNPKYFMAYSEYGSELVLSGHVHGGLVRLPLIGGVVSPDVTFFPKYDYGMFKEKNSTMLLTSGLGAHTIKFRLFNPPEIMAITLHGGNNGNIS